jgi:hypothetical protein
VSCVMLWVHGTGAGHLNSGNYMAMGQRALGIVWPIGVTANVHNLIDDGQFCTLRLFISKCD